MDQQIVAATRAAETGTTDDAVLRVAVRGFLTFVTGEPEFAKIFYVDMPAAGPHATEQLARAQHRYADLNQTWHERARIRHPSWPALPYDAYLALAGATAELVRGRVRAGQISTVPALEDTLVALHLAVMTGQPWPASGGTSVTGTSR